MRRREEITSEAGQAPVEKTGKRLHPWVPHSGESRPARWRGDDVPEFDVTVGIPWCNTPREVMASAQLCLAQEGVRALVVLVDCGSDVKDHETVEAWVNEQPDVEMHTLRALSVKHPSDFPAIAMDLVTSRCQTAWLFCTHADVYLKRRDVIAEFIAISRDSGSPAVGYRISPRPYDGWEKQISHTATLLEMETMLRLGMTWSQRRVALLAGFPDHSPELTRRNWPDTEIGLNECLAANGIKPVIVDYLDPIEINREVNEDHRLIHARSLTSAKLSRNPHYSKMSPINEVALSEAHDRLDEWGATRERARPRSKRRHESAFSDPLILERKPYDPNLPILVTGMGQGGTTCLMRALSAGLYKFHADFDGDSKSAEGLLMLSVTGQISQSFSEFYDEMIAYYGGEWIAKMPLILCAEKYDGIAEAEQFNVISATRDPLAKLLSLRRQVGRDVSGLKDQFRIYRRNSEVDASLLVPFESLLTKAEATLQAIWKWTGVNDFDLPGAIAEVVPNDPRYWRK